MGVKTLASMAPVLTPSCAYSQTLGGACLFRTILRVHRNALAVLAFARSRTASLSSTIAALQHRNTALASFALARPHSHTLNRKLT